MPTADIVVIGAGLAGLSCAVELAEAGASVFLAAKGMATTHWTHGGLDVAAPRGAATAADGVRTLAALRGHPYGRLADDVAPAVAGHLAQLGAVGIGHTGSLDDPLRPVPTAVGTLRRASILPAAQAAALRPWDGTGLLLIGFERFRDAWPAYAARNLQRAEWDGGPAEIRAVEVRLPGLETLHNINALTVARSFDDASWRPGALRAIAAAVPEGSWRIGLPAVLGVAHHQRVLVELTSMLGSEPFEIPSVPPSVPGMRLFEALRQRFLASGGRLQWGFPVVDVERDGDRVTAIHTEAASRTLRIAAGSFVLATGGFAGGGMRAAPDGRLTETVFGLPVAAPPMDDWFAAAPLAAQPIEAAGIEVDDELRPLDGPRNVHVIGSALAGMRYLDERCGDGVALASAHRAARVLGRAGAAESVRAEGAA